MSIRMLQSERNSELEHDNDTSFSPLFGVNIHIKLSPNSILCVVDEWREEFLGLCSVLRLVVHQFTVSILSRLDLSAISVDTRITLNRILGDISTSLDKQTTSFTRSTEFFIYEFIWKLRELQSQHLINVSLLMSKKSLPDNYWDDWMP